jgi:hypothetical protein
METMKCFSLGFKELREKLLSQTDIEAMATDTQETFVKSAQKIRIEMRSNLHKKFYRKSSLRMLSGDEKIRFVISDVGKDNKS